MKIVILIDYFQPKLGYQEFFLAKEMQKLGHQVYVATSNYYFPFPDSLYAYEHGLSLPSSVLLKEAEIKYVCEKIKNFYYEKVNFN